MRYVLSYYDQAQSTWFQADKISPTSGRDNDEFGSSVTVYDKWANAGSIHTSSEKGRFGDGGTGSAHVIELY